MEEESSAHIICDCMALSIRRNRLLGMYVVPRETIAALNPNKILAFIQCIGLQWDLYRGSTIDQTGSQYTYKPIKWVYMHTAT